MASNECPCGSDMVQGEPGQGLVCEALKDCGHHRGHRVVRTSSVAAVAPVAAVAAAPAREASHLRPSRGDCPKCRSEGPFETADFSGARQTFACEGCGHVFRTFTEKFAEQAAKSGEDISIFAIVTEQRIARERRLA